jgi:hypothetical protein
MDDTLRVRCFKRSGYLNPEIEKRADFQRRFLRIARLLGERPRGQKAPECLPFEKFHRDERTPVHFADVVDGADVGMIER